MTEHPLWGALPTRVDVRQGTFPPFGKDLIVKLDGVEQNYVVAIDTAAGWAERYVLDGQGNLVVTGGGDVETERVEGAWTLEWRDHP